MFTNIRSIDTSTIQRPLLQVVVDTEEEFNWSAFPDRRKTSVKHLLELDKVQNIFDQYGLKPCYVIDYPVASNQEHNIKLREAHADNRCEIGAHLHPWVTPPFSEDLSVANMYPGNLPYSIEKAKLLQLTEKIEQNFLHRPTAYKAGRYGFGLNTESILKELGYDIDLSVCPAFDHQADGGPDYHRYDVRPFHFNQSLLEIPLTSAYVGLAGSWSHSLFKVATKLNRFKAQGILARSGLVDRLVLSPEGFTSDEHIKITNFLLKKQVKFFTWSFHSSSIVPGNTSYVQSQKELSEFLDRFKRFFDFFFGTIGGEATSPNQFKKLTETKL